MVSELGINCDIVFGVLHLSYHYLSILSLTCMILTVKRSSSVQGFNDQFQNWQMIE